MELVKTTKDKEIYAVGGVGFTHAGYSNAGSVSSEYGANSSTIFDDDGGRMTFRRIRTQQRSYEYAPFGRDDQLPYNIIARVGENMVMSQNKLFNVLACYGSGLRFFDKATGEKSTDMRLDTFAFRNQLDRFFIEQAMDMKYFFFTVTCIILNHEGTKIVQMRHKEACFCRFEKATKRGDIRHVFYGNFRDRVPKEDEVEVLDLLDDLDPLGDLRVRLGFDPDPRTGLPRKPSEADPYGRATTQRKFAILTRFPTPGFNYYPVPFYASIFKDSWFDIYELIGKGKRAKIRNSAPPRFQVEVHRDYWDNLCDQEGITDPQARRDRIKKEKSNIEAFVTGSENIGKTWITGYYVDPASGKEVRMVRVYDVEGSKKEGGDWSDDIQEAANSICYGDNVHPNLVGATPGKTAMNNSGTDKRELFLLKQALETAFHHVMLLPIEVMLRFNGYENTGVEVPSIVLTTLADNKQGIETQTPTE